MVAVGDKNESILQLTARLNRAHEMLEPMKLNYCFNNNQVQMLKLICMDPTMY